VRRRSQVVKVRILESDLAPPVTVIEACCKHIAGFHEAPQQAQQTHSPERQVNPLVVVARHVDADRIETSLIVTQAV
jgi:hypothetical protein